MKHFHNVALFGASGRFGRSVASLLRQDPLLNWTHAITHSSSAHVGEMVEGLPLTTKYPQEADLCIDVSLPLDCHTRWSHIRSLSCPLVLGTTALTEEDLSFLDEVSRSIPVFYAPNFSIGMFLFTKVATYLAEHFEADEVDLIETHHRHKKDRPSGSALLLQKALEKTGQKKPTIHSIRRGEVFGEHTLLLETKQEAIHLSHEAFSRTAFAKGVVKAAHFLYGKSANRYSMEDLLCVPSR